MVKTRVAQQPKLLNELPVDLTPLLAEKISSLSPSVKTDYLNKEIFSKYVSKDTDSPELRRSRAIFKWLCTEMNNESTNERLLSTEDSYKIGSRTTFGKIVGVAQSIVRRVIGDSPPIEALIGSFSGGASTSRSRTCSNPAGKYLGKADVTAECLPVFYDLLIEELPVWFSAQNMPFNMRVVPGNELFTVPKKTDIDRVCCKEPDLNMFIQKGIGNHFRDCLRRTGINLNDQSTNRRLAREGSVTKKLSTLDLSSASDSVSEGVVALLLPEVWFTLLDSVRSRVTIIDGEEHRNHMFSSMGNGFTFELESLLFFALVRATTYCTGTRGVVSIYGDDIICPTDAVEDIMDVLEYFGFQVNLDKSCYSGSYRESCGGHYHDGNDITPFYIKEPICRVDLLINAANQLRKWAGLHGGTILDPEVEDIWLWLKGHVPECLWGGRDVSFKYQLVSHDTPERRISEETRRSDLGQVQGAYLQWINSTWDRRSVNLGLSTSRLTKGTGLLRTRRVASVNVNSFTAVPLAAVWCHEASGNARVAG